MIRRSCMPEGESSLHPTVTENEHPAQQTSIGYSPSAKNDLVREGNIRNSYGKSTLQWLRIHGGQCYPITNRDFKASN